jgi:hypothetical protein
MAITPYEISQTGLVLGVGWIAYVVSKSLPAYLAEKGKNLATKEDIHRLTEIAERIRSQFSQVNTVHRVQFEAEFQAYQALWSAAHDTVVAHIRWQSIAFETTTEKLEAFAIAHVAFANAVKRFEPFIPESVCKEFMALDELFVDAKMDVSLEGPKTPPAKSAARKAIDQAAQRCVAAIRTRLSEVLVI